MSAHLASILLIIYIVPILRIITWMIPTSVGARLFGFNAWVGRYEWFVGPIRDLGVTVILLIAAIWNIVSVLLGNLSLNKQLIGITAAAVLLSIFARIMKRRHRRKMLIFGVHNPNVSPREFFDYYYAGYGFLPVSLPDKARDTVDPRHISFKTGGASVQTLRPILPGIWNTHTLARLVFEAFLWKGADFCRNTADSLAAIWGSRVLEIARMELKTEGAERLARIDKKNNKFIFVFNHHSFVDFTVSPIAMSTILDNGSPRFKLRYLAAKDHFKDNWLLYRVLGLGRALEAVGTVFVERRNKKRDPGAAITEAAKFIMNSDVDIAMYPQGTRAIGNVDADGNRIDGAYYAVGKADRLRRDDGHIKKGAAYLAIEILKQLSAEQILYVVPVGLLGTGVVCPSNSMKIQTETTVTVVIGEPIQLKGDLAVSRDPESMRELADHLTKQIDSGLRAALQIDERLIDRFVADLQAMKGADVAAGIRSSIAKLNSRNNLVSKTLDYIYSLPLSDRNDWLQKMIALLEKPEVPDADLVSLKNDVTAVLIKTR